MQSLAFNFNDATPITGLIDQNGNPWFVIKDICNILGILNSSRAAEFLDEDEKLLYGLRIAGQKRDTWITNESGLYHLIFTSTKSEAKAFRKWVTSRVLPEIRKTGGYNSEVVLKNTLNFRGDLVRFKKQINSACRKVENSIVNVARGTLKLKKDNLFNEDPTDLRTVIKSLKEVIDNFTDKLDGYNEIKPVSK